MARSVAEGNETTESPACRQAGNAKKMKHFLLIFISIFLVSCASSRFDSNFAPVYVTNTSKFGILSTAEADTPLDAVQRMTAKFGEQSFDFDVYVISDSSQLSMTIFNEFGTTMASLFFFFSSLEFDSSVFPKNLKAEYIVADFQFCLYRANSLKSALANIGVDFEISTAKGTDGTSTESRILSKKGKIISKITKSYGINKKTGREEVKSIYYENFLRAYSYLLTGVEE